jgi:predicted nucleic acid-binding protein
MSWLLDADVLSQPAKKRGDPRVIAWLRTERDNCYTSAVVIAQLAYWVRTKRGKQREALQVWLTRLVDAMHGRVLGFNVSVAPVWAELQRELDERSAHADRGQLHRRNGPPPRADHRRPGRPTAGSRVAWSRAA